MGSYNSSLSLTLLILIITLLVPLSHFIVFGESKVGIGVSGSFYRFHYVIPIGQSVGSSDIYIVIFNQGNKAFNITMEYEIKPKTPFIVVEFSEYNFSLRPGEYKKVYIRIRVLDGAVPGDYDVTVGAAAVIPMPEGGCVAVPVGALHAPLTVVGEFGRVSVRTVDIEGRRVPCHIRLIRISREANYTVAESFNGSLTAVVAPGRYVARAFLVGVLLNETVFSVSAGEWKNITLVINTVYFEYFSVVPALDRSGRIGFARVVGVVQNLFMPLNDSEVVLFVWFNGELIDNVTIASLPLLPIGRSEYKFNYIPSGGWNVGVYRFRLFLYSRGILYTSTGFKELKVTNEMIAAPSFPFPWGQLVPWLPPSLFSLLVLLLVIFLVIVIAVLVRKKAIVIESVDYDEDRGELIVGVRNRSKRDAIVLKCGVYALPAKSRIVDVERPKIKPFERHRLPAKKSGEIVIRDRDGSIFEAAGLEGILVIVEANIGKDSKKFRLRK